MLNTRNRWLSAAQGADWFQLTRHDDPEPEPAPEADPVDDPQPDDPDDPEPEGADSLGDKGKQALERMKADRAAAKKSAAEERRKSADLTRRLAEFEDRDKSELERVTSKAEKLAEQAARATQRAVRAEVKAMAAGAFADPTDTDLLGDLSRYVDADGDIDTDAIETDLTDLLDRKPHLRKQSAEPERKKSPRPDPGQGPRPPEPATDFRTAAKDDLAAELAKVAPGFRLRS
jgi:hypothetical protein